MTVEEVKTRFVADIARYKKDIKDAQKTLQSFVTASDKSLNKRERAEYSLQKSIQRTAQEQAKALQQELRLRQQQEMTVRKQTTAQTAHTRSTRGFGDEIIRTARNVATLYYSVKAIASVFDTGIDFNRFTEDSEASFRVMLKSATAAKNVMQDLYNFAVDSPLTFEETVTSARQLMAYGFQSNELVDNMKTLGTVALATGHSLEDISYVYGTLRTQGRAYSRDLMQFAMRGIPIYDELAKVMKVSVKDIQKMTSDGKVGFAQVEQAFKNMTTEGGRFAGMLEERMKTLSGALAQFGDVWKQSMGIITKDATIVMTKEIRGITESLKDSKGELTTLGRDIGIIVAGLAGAFKLIGLLIHGLAVGITDLMRMTGIPQFLENLIALYDELSGKNKKAQQEALALAKATFREQEMSLNVSGSGIINMEEEEDNLDDLMKLLQDYQDRINRMRAQGYVEDEINIYAVAQLEQSLDIRNIEEKFAGNEELKKQALDIAQQIYEVNRDNIWKEAEEKKKAARAAALDAAVEGMDTRQKMLGVFNQAGLGTDLTSAESIITGMESIREAQSIMDKEIQYRNQQIEILRASYMDESDEMKYQQKMLEEVSTLFGWLAVKMGVLNTALDAINTEEIDSGKTFGIFPTVPFLDPIFDIANKIKYGLMALMDSILNTNPIIFLIEQFAKMAMQSKPLLDVIAAITASIGYALLPAFEDIAGVIKWLWDKVLVPFGNFVIDMINGLTRFTNKWLGTSISKLNHLNTTVEALTKNMQAQMMDDTMKAMVDKMNDMIDKQIKSLQDLYEVGALSGADYEARSRELESQKIDLDKQALLVDIASYNTLQEIRDWVMANAKQAGVDIPTTPTVSPVTTPIPLGPELQASLDALKTFKMPNIKFNLGGSFGGFASGTPNIPHDMPAMVHKGEGIVPSTFMDAIRAGELSLSGGGATKTQNSNTNIYITVEGSVTSENDLADTLYRKINQRVQRGYA